MKPYEIPLPRKYLQPQNGPLLKAICRVDTQHTVASTVSMSFLTRIGYSKQGSVDSMPFMASKLPPLAASSQALPSSLSTITSPTGTCISSHP
jgi:hypothetical protein|eukprot:COSAG01_NODE_10581_length_2129_cov_1.218227_4_plen_93_part_00